MVARVFSVSCVENSCCKCSSQILRNVSWVGVRLESECRCLLKVNCRFRYYSESLGRGRPRCKALTPVFRALSRRSSPDAVPAGPLLSHPLIEAWLRSSDAPARDRYLDSAVCRLREIRSRRLKVRRSYGFWRMFRRHCCRVFRHRLLIREPQRPKLPRAPQRTTISY